VKSDKIKVFLVSALIGAVVFVMIYGPYVINPFYDDWIFESGERDLVQHYLGFCLYRTSPWQFPLGFVTTASYPHDMSIVYTDAIPLFAFVGKLLSPVLPSHFQYLGLYGLLSMMLMGGISGLLILSLTHRPGCAILCSVFYTLSWTMLYRMFYHTSLTSHWLILLSFYIWLRFDHEKNIMISGVVYFVLSAVSMLIHPYIWAMCGGIVFMGLLEMAVIHRKVILPIICGFLYCVTGVISLWVFGALSSGVGAKLDVGKYEANLNTLYNSMGMGVLPPLPTALLQYEGFGYLGAGVLVLCLFVGVTLATLSITTKKLPHMSPRRTILAVTVLCFTIFSIVPEISFNDQILFTVKLGKVSDYIVGIFRSNGRFIWPVCYIILTAVLVFLVRFSRGKWVIALIVLGIALELFDMKPFITEKHRQFARDDYQYVGYLDDNEEIANAIGRYKHIVMDIDDGEIDQRLSFYAYLNGLTTNDFYYARPIESEVQNTLEALRYDMMRGKYDDTLLYVLGSDRLPQYKEYELHFYDIKGRYIASHIPIEGLEETIP
jgi:ABC-type multidrug transport system fused ATPase/permease subunit